MVHPDDLRSAVDAAFAVTRRDLQDWPDPHGDRYPHRQPLEEEYSRLTNPEKWHIVGARADAWLQALTDTGLATVELNASVRWQTPPGPVLTRTDRLVPTASDAIALVVARSKLGPVDDGGVTLGAGDPAVSVVWLPNCGCDACDRGSQDVLDELDEYVLSIVSGGIRRLSSGGREITSISKAGGQRWSASGQFRPGEVHAILDDPTGWDEISGTSWLGENDA